MSAQTSRDAADKAHRAIHLEALALLLFAGLAGLAAVLVLGQALSRQVAADAADNPTLAALGLSRRALVLAPLVRAGLVGLVGGAARRGGRRGPLAARTDRPRPPSRDPPGLVGQRRRAWPRLPLRRRPRRRRGASCRRGVLPAPCPRAASSKRQPDPVP